MAGEGSVGRPLQEASTGSPLGRTPLVSWPHRHGTHRRRWETWASRDGKGGAERGRRWGRGAGQAPGRPTEAAVCTFPQLRASRTWELHAHVTQEGRPDSPGSDRRPPRLGVRANIPTSGLFPRLHKSLPRGSREGYGSPGLPGTTEATSPELRIHTEAHGHPRGPPSGQAPTGPGDPASRPPPCQTTQH